MCDPAARDVVNVALPEFRETVPKELAPSLNVTVPVGGPEYAPVTIAVKVIDCPTLAGFAEDATAVEVA
jgi:hypothetical protein